MKKSAMNRRDFLRSVSATAATIALAGNSEVSGDVLPDSGSLSPDRWLCSNAGFEKPEYLSEETHELAKQTLTGQWGRKIKGADFSLPASTKNLSTNMQYACAAKLAAQEAPIWIHPDTLIVGSATLAEAREHRVPLLDKTASISHTTIGFDKVLKMGYKGLRAKIKERLSRGGLDADGKDLLNSMLICLDSADIWHKRYMVELEKRIASSSGSEKETYIKVHKASAPVPENPPTNFHEAVQSFRFAFAFQKLMGNWSGLGRIDEMLGPYLKQDLARGELTLNEAREILAHFWILGSEWTTTQDRGSGDAQHYQNIVLAGIDENGNEVANEVTYLVLDVVEELHISDFPIAVRINKNTPEKLLRRIAQVQRHGGGIVAIYNEEIVIEGLVKFGYPEKLARTFANDGCWEVLIPGQTTFIYCYGADMLEVLQRSLGIKDNGAIDDSQSFDDLYSNFVNALRSDCRNVQQDLSGSYKDKVTPCPLLSILVDDCIERGRSYRNRGARYTVVSPHAGGMADAANSLLAIKELVYEKQILSLSEFIEIVRNDWQGQEHLRNMVRNRVVSYGNDSGPADAMLHRVFNDYAGIIGETKELGGVLMPAGMSTFGREIEWIPKRTATPSGFKKGQVLATNFSPTPGTDLKGPTAVINSYTQMDFTRAPGGATLELKLHPASLKGEKGIDVMVALMKIFQKRGGWYVHMDVVDSALLLDAQRHPEKYPNLPVRIAGWSARFATLNKQWQDMVIGRTQQII